MDANGIFDNNLTVLEKVMDMRSRRHTILSGNIVNQDTPHYSAFDIAMDEEFERLESANPGGGELARTDARHLSTAGERPSERSYQMKALQPPLAKRDGNTVDIDRTMADLAENTLMYTALTRIMSKQLGALKNAIKGGS
ncbi:MAG: flagellar basal body rod protein FlgB [Pseudomonadota bacterium]